MKNIIEQLTENQLIEVERQMEIYSQGVQEIIPTEELEIKIAKSVIENRPLKIKLWKNYSCQTIGTRRFRGTDCPRKADLTP